MKKNEIAGFIANSKETALTWFSLMIDGSYTDYEDYVSNIKTLRQIHNNDKKLRSWCIMKFCTVISHEFDVSYGYAQKIILSTLGDDIENFNNQLMAIAKDMLEV